MAILRGAYLEALRAILLRAYQADGWPVIVPLLPHAVAWVKAGATAPIRADRREALRIMLTALWALDHAQHDAHALRHLLVRSGVEDADAEDVPETREPQV